MPRPVCRATDPDFVNISSSSAVIEPSIGLVLQPWKFELPLWKRSGWRTWLDVGTDKDSRIEAQPVGPGSQWPGVPQPPYSLAPVSAEDLVEQYVALGLSRTEALRLLQLGCDALNAVLAEIDMHAFTAVPVADQVSMLLPRLNIDSLADHMSISTAQVQSAMAMLTLEYVMLAHLT